MKIMDRMRAPGSLALYALAAFALVSGSNSIASSVTTLSGIESLTAQTPQLSIMRELVFHIDADHSGDISPGDTLTYAVTATNTGDVILSNVLLLDNLITPESGAKPCRAVDVDSSCKLTGTYRVTQADADAGRIISIDSASSDEIPTPVVLRGITPVVLNSGPLVGSL